MTDEIVFVRFAPEGVVHVLDRHEALEVVPEPLCAIMRREVAVCGRKGRPGIQNGLEAFQDVELCARCWQATPDHRRPELFQHPQETP